MHHEIIELIEKIKYHQHQHKVTIFNKMKNLQNMHAFNLTQGKLVQLLKKFSYFMTLNQNLGIEYLLKAINFIQPQFLRKNRLLIDPKSTNSSAEYLLCQGVLKIFQIVENRENRDSQTSDKKEKVLVFKKYVSNGSHISFSDYNEDQYQIISHTDCQMLKLPSKINLDPVKYAKQIIQTSQKFSKSNNMYACKNEFIKCISQVQKVKKISINPINGLSSFDLQELLYKAEIQSIESKTKIYQFQQNISKIGLILKGKIIEQNVKKKSKKIIKHDKAMLSFYKKNFSVDPLRVQKNETLLEKADWIGLQDYLIHLQVKPFRLQKISIPSEQKFPEKEEQQCPRQLLFSSQKQIRAKQNCEILWLPIKQFAKKFNYQINYSMLDQWRTLIHLKNQIQQKNDQIKFQLEAEKYERSSPASVSPRLLLPKLPGKLEQLSHNISGLEAKTELKSQMITKKHLKFKKQQKKNYSISDSSLLAVTMRKQTQPQTSINSSDPQINEFKKFSQFSKTAESKISSHSKNSPSNQKKFHSLRKIQPHTIELENTLQGFIMYPEAYEPERLSPELKKQLLEAEKAILLDSLLRKRSSKLCIDQFRSHSISTAAEQNRLSSFASKQSLSIQTPLSSPELMYKNLAQKISFKYPILQEKYRAQKLYKAKSKKLGQLSLKQRIQTMKILEESDRKLKNKIKHKILRQNKEPKNLQTPANRPEQTQKFSVIQQKLQLFY